jgi:hypothetical protein
MMECAIEFLNFLGIFDFRHDFRLSNDVTGDTIVRTALALRVHDDVTRVTCHVRMMIRVAFRTSIQHSCADQIANLNSEVST